MKQQSFYPYNEGHFVTQRTDSTYDNYSCQLQAAFMLV